MTIDKFNFAGKKAIVRVDFNVPLDENGKITDDTRIRGALPTLKKVLADGGSLIIMSHMGKPKGKVNAKYSLSQIVDAVSEKLGVPVQFAPDCAKAGDAAAALKPGEVLLLENLRFYPEEEGKPVGIDKEDPAYEDAKKAMKASQKEFAKTLASYADCYINDAFGTAHRKHASTAVIADYFDADNKMLGYLMEKEVQAVDNILKDIKRPFTAIMGGSKVSTKIGIIENLMDKVDNLILCGGMTYTFAKAQGGKIGNSIVEDDKLDLALDIIAKAKAKGVNLVLGSDCVAADAFSNDAHTQVVPANNIPDGWEGLDAGPETQKAFADKDDFALILGDDFVFSNGLSTYGIGSLCKFYEKNPNYYLGVQEVPYEMAYKYGIVKPETQISNCFKIDGIVEKPQNNPPSNMACVGRYILKNSIFNYLEKTKVGVGGEIQLTDALALALDKEDIYASEFDGIRYDVGSKAGYVEATIAVAMSRNDLSENMHKFFKK